MQLIGTVVRFQVQESSLKVGKALRRYDPAPLHSVSAMTLTPAGVVGLTEDGTTIIDVHHQDHPASKNHGGENGISLGFTSHYIAMRNRFGEHIVDGVAGENILIETDTLLRPEDVNGGVIIEVQDGARLDLRPVVVAAPCVEFARFALRFPGDARPDATVTEALRFLHDGMRGFYASCEGEPMVVYPGDRVFLA